MVNWKVGDKKDEDGDDENENVYSTPNQFPASGHRETGNSIQNSNPKNIPLVSEWMVDDGYMYIFKTEKGNG